MATFTVQAPDGRKLVLEGDSAPTEQELEKIFAASPSAPSQTLEQQFATRFAAEQGAGPLSKISGRLSGLGEALAGLVKTVGGGFQGVGELAGEAAVTPSALAPNVAQTGIEAGGRLSFDIGNLVRQAGRFAQEEPLQALQAVVSPISTLLPRAVSDEEIARAFERDLANQAFAEVRKDPIAGATLQGTTQGNFGEANIPLAEALPLAVGSGQALKLANAVEGAIKTIPVVEAAGRLAGGTGRAIQGGAGMAARKFIPQPLVENIVTTLDPKANAINPAKTIQAVKDTTAAVKRVLPELTPDDFAHPQTLADNATAKLQNIHAQREALAGVPTPINLDSVADAYLKMSNDPVIRLKFPELVPQLEAKAANYRGKTVSGANAERLNQYMNAENETLYSQVKQKRETTKKGNPIIAANEEAAQALRADLDAAFGGGFGELGKDYGAWKNIADMAQRQAVKQAKIEGRLGLYEGLSGLQAISTGGTPISTAISLAGGQVLKYAGSPLARFETSASRLAEAIQKGQIAPRAPPVIPTAVPPGTPPVITPAPVVPVTPPASTAVPLTLQQQIAALIQTYPPALRRDPALARIAAEAQIKAGIVP